MQGKFTREVQPETKTALALNTPSVNTIDTHEGISSHIMNA